MSIVAIDFETSGYSPASACSLGMARIGENGAATWHHLIRPPDRRVCFTHIHGLTWNMLKDQPPFPDLWDEIAAFIAGARLLVAHNAPFDRGVLEACCAAAGVPAPDIPFACTLKGARLMKRQLGLPDCRLDTVCAHFGISLDHHQALSDALGAAGIYRRLRMLGLQDADMLLRPCPKRGSAVYSPEQKQ
jgi:DNA polymerase-3 subunit epsilon